MSDPQAQFEAGIQAALNPGRIDPQFAAQLRSRLAAAARQPGLANRTRASYRPQLSRRAWAAAFVLLALATAVLVIGPQRVLAQVLEWLRYVPGIGFVDDRVGLRVLQEPVSDTHQNLTFTVQSGLIDAEHTWLTLYIDGIQQSQLPSTEDDPGCNLTSQLLLPGGSSYDITGASGSGGRTWLQYEVQFLALPTEIDQATLHMDCVPGLKEGPTPENWSFLLNFVPAPQDYVALPVVPLPTSQTTPTGAPNSSPLGIELRAENFVELEDGYLLQGVLDYSNSPFQIVNFSEFDLVFTDANDQRVEVEAVYAESTSPSPRPYVTNWSVRTARKDILGPVTITLPQLSVDLPRSELPETTLLFDFGSQPENGQVWLLDRSFSAGSGVVKVVEATYISEAANLNYLSLHMRFEGNVAGASLIDLDNASENGFGGGGGNSSGDAYQSIGYSYMPAGEHRLILNSVLVNQPGPWVVQVDLPPTAGETSQPTSASACLTQDLWLTPAASPAALPFNASRLLVEGPAPNGIYFPSLFLADPLGEQRTELAPGGWGALSPDGRHVAYTDGAGLHVLSVATRQDRLISTEGSAYSPAWSSSGEQLAFIKGGDGIWLIDANGENEHRLPGAHADMIGLPGWLPDGLHLVVVTNVAAGSQVQRVDVQTGALDDLFLIDNHKGGFTALSPDGEHIAYSGELFGSFNYGLYVSRLDGSRQQLVAQPGERVVFSAGVWSPDGQWLLVNPLDTAEYEPNPQHPIAVRPATCEVIPLGGVSGGAIGWAAASE